MKNTFYILIALILLMVACGQPSDNTPLSAELQRAEDLMYPHPDSALHILQAMTPPKDELNHATWALLMTQAKYKCDVAQSDSLVNVAYDFFMKGDDAQRKALALFCKGGIYEELNKPDDALNYYLEAVNVSDNIEDYRLRHLINVRIAILYAHRRLFDYAIEYCEMANQYALSSGDTYYMTNSYNNLGRVYSVQKRYQEAIKFYDKAIELGKKYNEVNALEAAFQEKAGICILLKKYDDALSLLKQIEPSRMESSTYQVLGHLYSKTDQIDSAYYYLNKAIKQGDIYVQRSAYQVLFNLSKKQKDYEKNAEYSVKLWKINDSINKIDRSKALIEMQEKYNEQRVRDELTAKMTLQKQRILMGIGVAILILCFIAYRIRIRNKERITRLAEAEERIETLNHLLEEAQKEPSPDAGQEDTFFKRILLQQLGIIRMVANTPTAQNQALLRRLAETGNDEMPAEELIAWKDLYPIIDRLYDNFYTRLMERFDSVLTDKEVQTCCLLCAGFSTKEIAVITRQAVNTVYIRKSSSRQKMGMPEGADIVEWVKGFTCK
ncbi:MAG: tetratricopeptide repeat protein [Bacteroides sp.]|nr:tetratricopeptide repeat protein [Bacteroides sp.]